MTGYEKSKNAASRNIEGRPMAQCSLHALHYMDNNDLDKDSFRSQCMHAVFLYIASVEQDIAFEAAIQEEDEEWID